jgi:predicted dehydrogenase
MEPIRTAVIGVGYLGKFHAQKYAQLPNSHLVAVCDHNAETAAQIAADLGTQAVSDFDQLRDEVEAVSIVVPTQKHYAIAKEFLAAGKHVLLEKPMTTTVAEARELVELAEANSVVLQIGHLERFNPAVLALENIMHQPMFIESHRVAPFNPRGADVNVILDLMIHDIDIILDMVDSPVTNIRAKGVAVLSKDIDIANARLEFESGCVANVTASRAGMKSERKMRLFQQVTPSRLKSSRSSTVFKPAPDPRSPVKMACAPLKPQSKLPVCLAHNERNEHYDPDGGFEKPVPKVKTGNRYPA